MNIDAGQVFYKCTSLTDWSCIQNLEVLNGTRVFQGLTISEIGFPQLASIGSNPFMYTTIGKITDLGKITEFPDATYGVLSGMNGTPTIVIPASFTYFGSNCFKIAGAKSITLIMKPLAPPTVSSTTSGSETLQTAVKAVYVEDEVLDTYKSASVWSEIADRIKPISEYTE